MARSGLQRHLGSRNRRCRPHFLRASGQSKKSLQFMGPWGVIGGIPVSMILDLQSIHEIDEIRGKIAIIGAGAAGITLAMELGDLGDIIVLESGGFKFERDTQALNDGLIIGHETIELMSSRLRFFGGTTNHWAGMCAPLDFVDFERHPDRPFGGWPFTLEDLLPFYKRAYHYCELGVFRDKSTVCRNRNNAPSDNRHRTA
jgi:hypothetical protein